MSRLRHLLEASALMLLFSAFRILPLDMASAIGGFMARAIGPSLKSHRIAKKNLAAVFPEKSQKERDAILTGMWDHLGRVAAELPHLPGNRLFDRVTMKNAQYFPTGGQPVLYFSGHIGNWELLPGISKNHNVPVTLVYRQANNPYVDAVIARLRAFHAHNMFSKGPKGAFKMARAIKNNETIAMLVDQKMNDGIAVPFFGRTAMTAPAIAQLALRYDMPIIPAYAIRTKGAHFEGHVFEPLVYAKTGDVERDTLTVMTEINRMLEMWIRQHPEQWFWVHKRWPNA